MSKYELNGSVIMRDGVAVADFDTAQNVVVVRKEAGNYRAAMQKWLSGTGVAATFKVAAEAPETQPADVAATPEANEPAPAKPVGGEFKPHKHPQYPDGPDLDPMLGDKTPAFVEWRARHEST